MMKTSISFLNSHYTFDKTVKLINESTASFIHVDVMDGLFVNNVTPFNKDMLDTLKNSKKPKEVHLMTLHLKKFIDVFMYINPECIIYEFEATSNHEKLIQYIKSKKVKVGIAINPFTNIDLLVPYLKKIDMVLVMSVIPGYGGQKFIKETVEKLVYLQKIREEKQFSFLLSVDGGINEEAIEYLKDISLDRVVAGSYVCKTADFNKQIQKLEEGKK